MLLEDFLVLISMIGLSITGAGLLLTFVKEKTFIRAKKEPVQLDANKPNRNRKKYK